MLGVVVHGPFVQNDDGVFGDEVAVVREVFGRDVPRSEPKGVVAALDLCGSCQLRLIGMVEAGWRWEWA